MMLDGYITLCFLVWRVHSNYKWNLPHGWKLSEPGQSATPAFVQKAGTVCSQSYMYRWEFSIKKRSLLKVNADVNKLFISVVLAHVKNGTMWYCLYCQSNCKHHILIWIVPAYMISWKTTKLWHWCFAKKGITYFALINWKCSSNSSAHAQ